MVLAVRPTQVQWQKMLILNEFPICLQAMEFCRENLNSFGSRLPVVVHPQAKVVTVSHVPLTKSRYLHIISGSRLQIPPFRLLAVRRRDAERKVKNWAAPALHDLFLEQRDQCHQRHYERCNPLSDVAQIYR